MDINEALNLAVKLIGSGQLSNAVLQMKLAQANDTIKAQGEVIADLMKQVNGGASTVTTPPDGPTTPPPAPDIN